jgi:hypothetical protein
MGGELLLYGLAKDDFDVLLSTVRATLMLRDAAVANMIVCIDKPNFRTEKAWQRNRRRAHDLRRAMEVESQKALSAIYKIQVDGRSSSFVARVQAAQESMAIFRQQAAATGIRYRSFCQALGVPVPPTPTPKEKPDLPTTRALTRRGGGIVAPRDWFFFDFFSSSSSLVLTHSS